MMAATSFLPNDAYSYSTQPQLNNSTEEEDSFCVADNVTECAGYLSLVSCCVSSHVAPLTYACSLFARSWKLLVRRVCSVMELWM